MGTRLEWSGHAHSREDTCMVIYVKQLRAMIGQFTARLSTWETYVEITGFDAPQSFS